MLNFDDILLELSYKVPEGIVDLTKTHHLVELKRILKENGVDDPSPYIVVAEYYFKQINEEDDSSKKVQALLNQTIINPETDNTILVRSALTYDKDTAVYKTAEKMLTRNGVNPKDINTIAKGEKKEKERIDKTISKLEDKEKKGQLSKEEKKELDKVRKERDQRLTSAELTSSAEKNKIDTTSTQKKSNGRKLPDPRGGRTVSEIQDSAIREIEETANIGEITNSEMDTKNEKYSDTKMPQGYTDDEWYSSRKGSTFRRTEDPFKFDKKTRDQLLASGFPKKYIQLLERFVITQSQGKKPPITEFIDRGGAGAIQAQCGEVMAMMFMSLPKEQRNQLEQTLRDEVTKTKIAILKKNNSKEYNQLKKDGLIDADGNPTKDKNLKKKLDSKLLKSSTTVVEHDWISAAINQSEAFDAAMDEKYGKGNWRLEGAAWDVPQDIESMGLRYKDKGFSTDVMLRVQPLKNGKPSGPAIAQKCSLKKDENIFFYNGSTNEVNNFVLQYLPQEKQKRVKGLETVLYSANAKCGEDDKACQENKIKSINLLKRRYCGDAAEDKNCSTSTILQSTKNEINAIRDEAYQSAPPNVRKMADMVNNFPEKQKVSSTNMAIDVVSQTVMSPSVLDTALDQAQSPNAKNSQEAADLRIPSGEIEFAKKSYKIVQKCSSKFSKEKGDVKNELVESCIKDALGDQKDKYDKAIIMAMKVVANSSSEESTTARASLRKHFKIGEDAGNALLKELANPENEELNRGLREKLAQAFPIKTIMDGEEFMAIGGIKITQETLKSVFGVDSYEDLEQNIQLKENPDGSYMLVYSAGGKGEQIPIGIVQARQKGKGYEGTVGFEVACAPEFALRCSQTNINNGDTSGANTRAMNSINKRINKEQPETSVVLKKKKKK